MGIILLYKLATHNEKMSKLSLVSLFHILSAMFLPNIIWTSRSGALRRNGSTCVDLVEDYKKATSIHFLSHKKVKSKQRNRMAIIVCTRHVQLRSLQTIDLCIKLSRQRPARSPSFARHASARDCSD